MTLNINGSDHAARGTIVATQRGKIIWRGVGKEVGVALQMGADRLHVHTADVPVLRDVLSKRFEVRVMG